MENVVAGRLQSLQFGTVQRYKNIAIVPLIAPDGAFRYRTLTEALATSDITITEISASGSVPELLVVNRGKTPVLLIDGEELAGAKQNRVLNTSILLKELSETRVPVSCTEQGRWSYSSPAFASSGNVMAQKARAMKSRSVPHSADESASYHSDQGEVWHEIAELSAKACCYSPTSAMNDVFKSREDDLHRCIEIFQCVPGQLGLLAFTDARPAGFDLVSLGAATPPFIPSWSGATRSKASWNPPQRMRPTTISPAWPGVLWIVWSLVAKNVSPPSDVASTIATGATRSLARPSSMQMKSFMRRSSNSTRPVRKVLATWPRSGIVAAITGNSSV